MIPQLDGLLEVALYVDDVERSTRFYEALFGVRIIASDERLSAVGIGDRQVLLVCKRGASTSLPLKAHDASGRQHVALAIPASALESWQARLLQQGVTIEATRHWERGGVSLYFRDPDGHLIELATPGVWSTY
jgi:catechol 2,3-dioxygenase-like lactoylglutathione lyase family enzyme